MKSMIPQVHITEPKEANRLITKDPIGEYERAWSKQIEENQQCLRNLSLSSKSTAITETPTQHMTTKNHAKTKNANRPLAYQMSSNNCGLHTFIRLLTLHYHDLKMKMSTNFIETQSILIRAWMIHILLQYDFGEVTWQESLWVFIKQNGATQWFNRAAQLRKTWRRNQAIATLMPNKFLSGDAITFCRKAINYKPPKETYIFDVLMSVQPEPNLWKALWKHPWTKYEHRVTAIVLHINV